MRRKEWQMGITEYPMRSGSQVNKMPPAVLGVEAGVDQASPSPASVLCRIGLLSLARFVLVLFLVSLCGLCQTHPDSPPSYSGICRSFNSAALEGGCWTFDLRGGRSLPLVGSFSWTNGGARGFPFGIRLPGAQKSGEGSNAVAGESVQPC